MLSCTRYGLWLAAMFLMLMVSSSRAQEGAKQISEEEIQVHLGESADCEVNINSLDYFDFTGGGVDETIVVASTCATGTWATFTA
jgi:hypothetical protein